MWLKKNAGYDIWVTIICFLIYLRNTYVQRQWIKKNKSQNMLFLQKYEENLPWTNPLFIEFVSLCRTWAVEQWKVCCVLTLWDFLQSEAVVWSWIHLWRRPRSWRPAYSPRWKTEGARCESPPSRQSLLLSSRTRCRRWCNRLQTGTQETRRWERSLTATT